MTPARFYLPSLVTSMALLCAFGGLIAANDHRYAFASAAVLLAIVFDGLDGRVARMMRTETAFGGQYDSLCDMCAFGIVPALIAYDGALRDLGCWGFAIGFLFLACASLRLARFNVNAGVVDKRWFQGLPSPAAAAAVVSYIWWSAEAPDAALAGSPLLCAAAVAVSGIAMVSKVPYPSGKRLPMILWLALIALAAASVAALARFVGARAALPGMLCGLVWIYVAAGLVFHRVMTVRQVVLDNYAARSSARLFTRDMKR
ncbi:CDP-alcohol phosphatidyltransferase family protein [Paraburkholderia dipogonis]|uniref:CDP-alcohol phosphatidyltransferase family protein n=1 Tax=Paraburkholderia dipogonis TaxID=1211383 RepID=UPI0038B76E23